MEMVMFSELHREWVMHMPQLFHLGVKVQKMKN